MVTKPKEDAVSAMFGSQHLPEHFESNRNAGLGSAGICVAISLTIVQTQIKTEDAVTSLLYACIAIPFFLLSAFINEYFFFLGERSYGFCKYVRIPLRIINGAATGLLVFSFSYAVCTISPLAYKVIIIPAAGSVFAFWVFHQALAIWLEKQPNKQN
jgi:hypothetical protein